MTKIFRVVFDNGYEGCKVVARDAEEAIKRAKNKVHLGTKEAKHFWVSEVELLAETD